MLIVNVTSVGKDYSGVGVYSLNVISRLSGIIKDAVIYCSPGVFKKITGRWKVKPVKHINRALPRWLWLHIVFPFYTKKNNVLYCTFSEAPILFRGKLIVTVHDLIPLNFPGSHSGKLKFYYSKILPVTLKKAGRIIAISETVKKDILKYFPFINKEKIEVVYNGYDSNVFNASRDGDGIKNFKDKYSLDKYLLYVGRISRVKNVLLLIKSFNLVKDSIPHSLVIVGKDESGILPEAEEYILANRLNGRVKFIERLEIFDLPGAYKGASLFVQPSLAEGFGLPVIEAMATGLPCLLSDIEVFREISAGAALLFNPKSPNELAEKILQLLNNENIYNMYRDKGLERAKAFSWDDTVNRINLIINEAEGLKS